MDILDYLHSLSEEEKARATAAIMDVEERALENMQIMPGALELCRILDDRGLPRWVRSKMCGYNVKGALWRSGFCGPNQCYRLAPATHAALTTSARQKE